jgi:hypothetical protein
MADNVQKTPIARTLNQFAERKALGAISLFGKALPASVVAVVSSGVVTVKFEIAKTPNSPYTLPNVTVPLFGPEYIRYPIQAGCMGVVFPSDAYLGGVSGLGGGVADLSQRANLSSLVFFPIGNKAWTATDDPNSLVLYGPDGVIIRDQNSKTKITVTADGVVIDVQAGKAVTVNGNMIVSGNLQLGGNLESHPGSTYSGDIKTTGDVIAKVGAAQVGLSTHQHAQGNDTHGDGEQPTDAPTAGT